MRRIPALSLVLLCVGCNRQPAEYKYTINDFTGRWGMGIDKADKNGFLSQTVDFNPNGVADIVGGYRGFTFRLKGHWKAEGDKFTFTADYKEATLPPGIPGRIVPQVHSDLVAAVPTGEFRMKWISQTRFECTNAKGEKIWFGLFSSY